MFEDYVQNALTWPKSEPKPSWETLNQSSKDAWIRRAKRDI